MHKFKHILFLLFIVSSVGASQKIPAKTDLIQTIELVNNYWQSANPTPGNPFWDVAAYHTGNMEAYFVTGNETYRRYSESWAEKNQWKGAKSDDKSQWKYKYGETPQHVLFGDWQICFQTYIDLYNLAPDSIKIARAREVLEYEMSTPNNDYWWWADGLYMVMPVMTKMYKATKNPLYLEKLNEYFIYAKSIMYDPTLNQTILPRCKIRLSETQKCKWKERFLGTWRRLGFRRIG